MVVWGVIRWFQCFTQSSCLTFFRLSKPPHAQCPRWNATVNRYLFVLLVFICWKNGFCWSQLSFFGQTLWKRCISFILTTAICFLLHFCTICFWTVHEIIDNTGLSVCFCIMKLIWPKVRFLTTIATTRVVFFKGLSTMEFIVAVFFGARKKKHFMYSAVTVQARRCWSLEGSNLWKWKDMIVKKKNNSGGRSGRFVNDPFSGYSRSIPPLHFYSSPQQVMGQVGVHWFHAIPWANGKQPPFYGCLKMGDHRKHGCQYVSILKWIEMVWLGLFGVPIFGNFHFFSQQMTMCTTGFHTFRFPGVWLFGGCLYIRWLHYRVVAVWHHTPSVCWSTVDAISYCAPSVSWC